MRATWRVTAVNLRMKYPPARSRSDRENLAADSVPVASVENTLFVESNPRTNERRHIDDGAQARRLVVRARIHQLRSTQRPSKRFTAEAHRSDVLDVRSLGVPTSTAL